MLDPILRQLVLAALEQASLRDADEVDVQDFAKALFLVAPDHCRTEATVVEIPVVPIAPTEWSVGARSIVARIGKRATEAPIGTVLSELSDLLPESSFAFRTVETMGSWRPGNPAISTLSFSIGRDIETVRARRRPDR